MLHCVGPACDKVSHGWTVSTAPAPHTGRITGISHGRGLRDRACQRPSPKRRARLPKLRGTATHLGLDGGRQTFGRHFCAGGDERRTSSETQLDEPREERADQTVRDRVSGG